MWAFPSCETVQPSAFLSAEPSASSTAPALEPGQADGKQTWPQESCLLCYIRSAQPPLHQLHSTLFSNSYVITFLVRSLKVQNIISYMCHSN